MAFSLARGSTGRGRWLHFEGGHVVRVVAQRVRAASVSVDGTIVGAIDHGLALLVGIEQSDESAAVDQVADKIAVIRVFEDRDGKMNLSTSEIGGAMLVVSQFT